MVSRSGHPATVSRTVMETTPSRATSTEATMPNSVIGLWISGSLTVASAARTASTVGGADMSCMVCRVRLVAALGSGRAPAGLPPPLALVELVEQPAEFGAQEVAG